MVLAEPGNFNTRAGVNMHYPARIRSGSQDGTSDPLYLRLIEHRRIAGKDVKFGDALDVARVVADAAEAESPDSRYMIGKDAEQLVALKPVDFDRIIEAMLSLPEE